MELKVYIWIEISGLKPLETLSISTASFVNFDYG